MATPSDAAAPALPRHRGRVKQVLSGDTIVIQGAPRNGPPPERQLSFAGITAPRLARRPHPKDDKVQNDEPFAWEAREFLRRKLVGQEVVFTVEYTVPSGREFGTVYLSHGTMEENITRSLLTVGLAKIREGARGDGEAFQELVQVAAQAQAGAKGLWAVAEGSTEGVRDIKWTLDDPVAFTQKNKGKALDAVIEHVRDGSTVRAFLLPSFQYVSIMMAGIRTPSFKRNEAGVETPEPFALEAKYYTEVRLLQREVKIVVEGTSGGNRPGGSASNTFLFGTVIHPKGGNISEHLLREGYARCVDSSIGMVTQGRDAYRGAERQAKEKRLRIWKTYTPSQSLPIADKKFSGVVREIVGVDCMMIETPAGVKKIHLSSIRRYTPPKVQQEAGAAAAAAGAEPAPRRRGNRLFDTAHGLEAREFLRKKLIGQTVQVEVDYIKPANEGYPEKTCATIKSGGINLAEALVSKGYCSVVRHRGDDEDRSSQYDELLVAESRAMQNGKGVHAKKDKGKPNIIEVQKREVAERFLTSLQRNRQSGVVEFISSGSRYRVYIPSQNCIITVLLAGISCPRTGRGDTPDQPFAQEAVQLARSLAMQHDVDVEIEDIDRNGNFVGHVWVKGTNLSVALLERGFAQTHRSADRYKNCSLYMSTEETAKSKLVGLWANYTEPVKQEKTTVVDEKKDRKTQYDSVVVCDVLDPVTLTVQAADAAPVMQKLMADLAGAFVSSPPVTGAISPKNGELIAAQFSADDCWYRAKVVGKSAEGVEVVYIDYGNSEVVPLNRIASLPAVSNILSLPAQSREVKFALIAPPPEDYAGEATEFVQQMLTNQTVLCNTEYNDGGVDHVTILDPETKSDYAKELLESGYAHVARRKEYQFRELIATYSKAVDSAKDGRFGMWMYGDATPDDAREFGAKRA